MLGFEPRVLPPANLATHLPLQGLIALVREYLRGQDDVEADTMCTLRNCLKLVSLNSPFNDLNVPVLRNAYLPPPPQSITSYRPPP
jgi:hypothetical protein